MAAKKKTTKSKTATSAAKRSSAKPARTASKRSEGLSLTAMSPSLTVADVETSLAWYCDVLGFKVQERWEREGKLMGAAIGAGKTWLMLGQDDWKKGRDRIKGQGVRMYCMTDQDVDAIAARIKARGGKLSQEPMDQAWGMRDIALEDLDGYKLTIAKELKKKKKK